MPCSSDDDIVPSEDGRSVASVATSGYSVVSGIRHSKHCKTCGASPDQKSPLAKAHPGDPYGGCRPWAKYQKNKDDMTKTPLGHFCLICFNTYRALPDSLTIPGGMAVFAKHLFQQMDRVHAFRRSVNFWIKSHNDASTHGTAGSVRLKDRKGLEEAQTLTTNCVQGMRHRQRMTFIEISKYRQDFGDPSDNGHQVTTHVFDGAVKEGVFVSQDRDGYHEFEAYQDNSVSLETTIDDGTTILSASQVQDKFDIAAKSFKAVAKRRRDASGSVNLQALLAIATRRTAAAPVEIEEPEASLGSDDENDADDDSDKDDTSLVGSSAMQRQLHELSFPCGKPPKPTLVGIAKSGKRRSSPDQSDKLGSGLGPKRAKTVKNHTEGDIAGPRSVANLDGRSGRVLEGVRNSLSKIEHDIDSVLDLRALGFDSLSALADTHHGHSDVKKIQSRCSALMNTIRETLLRIDRSRSKPELIDEAQQLKDQHKSCKCVCEIMKLLSSSKPHADSLVAALDEAPTLGIKLGPSMCLVLLECKIKSHLEFERYDKLCEDVLSLTANMVTHTIECSASHQMRMQDTACRAIEEGIMFFFRSMKDNKAQDRTNLFKSLVCLCSAIALTSTPSLIDSLKDDVRHVLRILEADQCDLEALSHSVSCIDNLKEDSTGLLLQNMCNHAACQGYFDSAKQLLASRQGEMSLLRTMGTIIDELQDIRQKVDSVSLGSLQELSGFIDATRIKDMHSRALAAKNECKKLKGCIPRLIEVNRTWLDTAEFIIGSAMTTFVCSSDNVAEMSSSEVAGCHKDTVVSCLSVVALMIPGAQRDSCTHDLRVFQVMGVLFHSFMPALKGLTMNTKAEVIQDLLRPFHKELRAALAEKSAIECLARKITSQFDEGVEMLSILVHRGENCIAHAETASHCHIVDAFRALVADCPPEIAALVQQTDRAIEFPGYGDADIEPFLSLRSLVIFRFDLEPHVLSDGVRGRGGGGGGVGQTSF